MPRKLRAITQRQTLADQIYASLKQAIVAGDLRPGERLKEAEVALSLGASRTPVREAFSRLEHEGLVRSLRSGGSTVVELSETEMREIFGLIQVLETYAVRLASERITSSQIERLDEVCRRAEQLTESDREKLGELNRKFHQLVIEASGNQRLQILVGSLRSAMQPYRALTLQSQKFRAASVQDHRRMIELLQAADAEALGRLMTAHLETAQQVTLDGIMAQAQRLARTP